MASRTIEVSDLVVAIEQQIEARGISDAQAARELNVAPQSISQWKRGSAMQLQGNPALHKRIALFLGIAPLEVLRLHGFLVDSDATGPYLAAAS